MANDIISITLLKNLHIPILIYAIQTSEYRLAINGHRLEMDVVIGLAGGKVQFHVLVNGHLLTDDVQMIESPLFIVWIHLPKVHNDIVGAFRNNECIYPIL